MNNRKRVQRITENSSAFRPLKLGQIKPLGWLRDQLRLQADGLTGHLETIWADVGPNSAWLGGTGEDWERGPYYLDGLLPLAWTLGDKTLKAKAQIWIESIFSSQRDNGFFGPTSNNDWWPRMVVLKVIIQYFEASGDERSISFLTRYFRHQQKALPKRPLKDWGQARGVENILCALWLHERTGEAWLKKLATLLLTQTLDWETYLLKKLIKGPAKTFSHFTHVVNVAMALKYFAAQFLLDGDPKHLAAARKALANLDRYHGNAVGMFNGDEWLAGDSPSQGFELCAVVEFMFSLQHLVRVFGQREFSDRLERVAYNALPAHFDARMTAHQYHQQTNQVLCNIAPRNWTMAFDDANTFGLSPHFGCCTANFHQGWPKFAGSVWMHSSDGGLAATAYAPNQIKTVLGGVSVSVKEQTDYPFKEMVRFEINPARPVRFPLHLRIPSWCEAPEITCNGVTQPIAADVAGYARLERTWRPKDVVTLHLPLTLRAIKRPNRAIALAAGPLNMVFWPGEIWERVHGSPAFGDWEVRPRNTWAFCLALDPAKLDHYKIETAEMRSPPFWIDNPLENGQVNDAPLRVRVPLRQLTEWVMQSNSAAQPPTSPVRSLKPIHMLYLIPYGCTRIRVAEMPVTSKRDAVGSIN
jgi:Beta-L-arabinofuranosidase, GH127